MAPRVQRDGDRAQAGTLILGEESFAIETAPGVTLAMLREAIEAHDDSPGRVLASSPRGQTTRVPWDEESEAAVKETRRRPGILGLARALASSIVGSATGGNRARRAFLASRALAAAGVPTPAPLASLASRERTIFVARFVLGERLDRAIAYAFHRGEDERLRRMLAEAGELVADVHAAGVAHGDLKPQNVILADRGMAVLDLDGATLTRAGPGLKARARDLAALDAYLRRGPVRVDDEGRAVVISSYLARLRESEARLMNGEAAGPPAATEGAALRKAVAARSDRKLARWRAAGA